MLSLHGVSTLAAQELSSIPESRNQIVTLSDRGIEPQNSHMKLEDSIVFFLNQSTDALITLEVDFNGKKTHCSTSNLAVDENQKVHSKRPIGVRDFASICFHERGRYAYTIYGLPVKPQGVSSAIIVE